MSVTRREFIHYSGTALGLIASGCATPGNRSPQEVKIMTVRGPIKPEQMGLTLPHEHVLVDFIGADKVTPDRYRADEVFATALPFLERIYRLGARTLVECTPAYIGRDPRLLERLSIASQLHLLTNTGLYGAGKNKFLPPYAHEESAESLSDRWLKEWRDGIDDTGIRPGFMKIGVDSGPLSAVHRKLVQAAAQTHLASGLTIASHTGDGIAALEEIAVLQEAGVDPSAFIWVHAQSERDPARHLRAAEAGAWVEFDGLSTRSLDRHVDLLGRLRRAGFLGRLLVSHDAGWYHVGEARGGTFRPFDFLLTHLRPALKQAGWTTEECDQLCLDNPAKAFGIKVRALEKTAPKAAR